MAWLAEKGERRSFATGEVLYEQGLRDAPFFIIESGRVDLIDHKPGKEIWIAEADAGTFIGDIATFTGEPAMAECVASEPTETIAFDRPGLRAMLAGVAGDGRAGAGLPPGPPRLARGRGPRRPAPHRRARLAPRLRGPRPAGAQPRPAPLPRRRPRPVRGQDPGLARHHARGDPGPRSATTASCATPPRPRWPASSACARRSTGSASTWSSSAAGRPGLAAAVYGGSEGFRTFVAEAWGPGGQAGTSNRIENYLGFPSGISGAELTRAATLQARRFDAVLSSFHRAVELTDGPEGLARVDLDDGQYVLGRTVVMATGARWRELAVPDVERYRGAGLYHAAMPADAERFRDEDVLVVGGGNSAGQAATHLARHARSVRVAVRGDGLSSTMSRYLVDRIERSPRIEVLTGTEVVALHGRGTLDAVTLRNGGGERRVPVRAVFVMIGAEPCTEAVTGVLRVDAAGYLLCGPGAAACDGRLSWPLADRAPHLLETVRPGVFAAGDVRAGATNRVAGAVGDGALATRFVHAVLDG